MRTINHELSLAMWHTNMITAPDDSAITNWETRGIDYSTSSSHVETSNSIVVPNSDVALNEEQISYLQQMVNPLQDDENSGIQHYLNAVDIVGGFIDEETIDMV